MCFEKPPKTWLFETHVASGCQEKTSESKLLFTTISFVSSTHYAKLANTKNLKLQIVKDWGDLNTFKSPQSFKYLIRYSS